MTKGRLVGKVITVYSFSARCDMNSENGGTSRKFCIMKLQSYYLGQRRLRSRIWKGNTDEPRRGGWGCAAAAGERGQRVPLAERRPLSSQGTEARLALPLHLFIFTTFVLLPGWSRNIISNVTRTAKVQWTSSYSRLKPGIVLCREIYLHSALDSVLL